MWLTLIISNRVYRGNDSQKTQKNIDILVKIKYLICPNIHQKEQCNGG